MTDPRIEDLKRHVDERRAAAEAAYTKCSDTRANTLRTITDGWPAAALALARERVTARSEKANEFGRDVVQGIKEQVQQLGARAGELVEEIIGNEPGVWPHLRHPDPEDRTHMPRISRGEFVAAMREIWDPVGAALVAAGIDHDPDDILSSQRAWTRNPRGKRRLMIEGDFAACQPLLTAASEAYNGYLRDFAVWQAARDQHHKAIDDLSRAQADDLWD